MTAARLLAVFKKHPDALAPRIENLGVKIGRLGVQPSGYDTFLPYFILFFYKLFPYLAFYVKIKRLSYLLE